VSKIGFPHNPSDSKKGHLRYVQVTDDAGKDWRYFYVDPVVSVGDMVDESSVIGTAQDLIAVYGKEMTNHIHVEIKRGNSFIDPTGLIFS